MNYFIYGIIALAVFILVGWILDRWNLKRTFRKRRKLMERSLAVEMSRADRFHYNVGFLMLELNEAIPRGVHKFLPGKTVYVEHLKKGVRQYDVVMQTAVRRYSVILPGVTAAEVPSVIKKRFLGIASEQGWGKMGLGVAIYPIDVNDPAKLITLAEEDLKIPFVGGPPKSKNMTEPDKG